MSLVNFITPTLPTSRSPCRPFFNTPRCEANPPTNPTADEPSLQITTSSPVPAQLLSTTIYHSIPSIPSHHAHVIPPVHRNDNDPLLLAISLPPAANPTDPFWVRARFVRTRPFFLESRFSRRIFRGLYGTPGATGLDAPVKPKASCAHGLAQWGLPDKRVVIAFGPRSLPHALRGDTLVTRGVTALGTVLTDADELADERPTELSVAPLRLAHATIVVGVTRAPTGRIVAAFVTELELDGSIRTRHPKLPISRGANVVAAAANDRYVVIALRRATEESGGLLSSVLGTGRAKAAPVVDMTTGTTLVVLDRESGATGTTRLDEVCLTRLLAVDLDPAGQGVLVRALGLRRLADEVIRLSTVADAASGDLWASETSNAVPRGEALTIPLFVSDRGRSLGVGCKGVLSVDVGPDREVADVAVRPDGVEGAAGARFAYVVFDRTAASCGLMVSDENIDKGEDPPAVWLAEDTADRITGATFSPDGAFVSVLISNDDYTTRPTRVLVFKADAVVDGPTADVVLDSDTFGKVGQSAASVWTSYDTEWEDSKRILSAYEIFESRKWNDIDSGFSSMGFR